MEPFHLFCSILIWSSLFCLAHIFRGQKHSTLCHVPSACTQPRPPSALASIASECRNLACSTCGEDMCSPEKVESSIKKITSSCLLQKEACVCWQPVYWSVALLGQNRALMRLPIMCAQRLSSQSLPPLLQRGQPVCNNSPAAVPSPH